MWATPAPRPWPRPARSTSASSPAYASAPIRSRPVGFGTHHGTVIAGDAWGAPAHELPVPPARPGSPEDALHPSAPSAALLTFPRRQRVDLRAYDDVDHYLRPEL